MSKNYINLKNVSYREYRPSDYAEVLSIFIKFQTEAQISTYHSYGKGQSERFYHLFLNDEFQKLIRRCPFKYVGIDEDTKKIIGFGCLSRTDQFTGDPALFLEIVFKDPKYIFNRKLKYLFILAAKKLIKTEGRIFALLGKREKFDKYFAFIKKIFKVKVRSTSIFDKILVEFL